jgi:hypothetical protein
VHKPDTSIQEATLQSYKNELNNINNELQKCDAQHQTYLIQIEVDHSNREKYYCIPIDATYSSTNTIRSLRGRPATIQFREGNEMLKQLIIERKEKLGL